eukprot:g1573.t1
MKTLFVLVLFVLTTFAAGTPVKFDICGHPTFTPDSVSVAPVPVKIGKRLLVRIRGTADRTVTGGKFNYEIAYRVKTVFKTFYVTAYKETEDLCHRAACPIKPGFVMLEYRNTLPRSLPKGLYRISISAETNSGDTLLCIVVHLDFKRATTMVY